MAMTLELPVEVKTRLKAMAADRGQDASGCVSALNAREITAAMENEALSADRPLSQMLEPIRRETTARGDTDEEIERLMEATLAEARPQSAGPGEALEPERNGGIS